MKCFVFLFIILAVLLTNGQSNSGNQKQVVDQKGRLVWSSFTNLDQSYESKKRKCHKKTTTTVSPADGDREDEVKCNSSAECKKKKLSYCIKSIGICTNETESNCVRNEYCLAKNKRNKFCVKNKCAECQNYTDCRKPDYSSCTIEGKCLNENTLLCQTDGYCQRQKCYRYKNCRYKFCSNRQCKECQTDNDCSTKPFNICQTNNNIYQCVECTSDNDNCANGKVCFSGRCVNETYYSCRKDKTCQQSSCPLFEGCRYKYCVPNQSDSGNHCIMCKNDDDCTDKKYKYCFDRSCGSCKTDSDCKANSKKKYCTFGHCFECNSQHPCPKYQKCNQINECHFTPALDKGPVDEKVTLQSLL